MTSAAPAKRDLAPVALVDLLDRLLGTGVVVAGDVVVSLAGVDLVEIRLQLLVTSIRAEMAERRRAATR
ncbi:gas vesicle protein GvpJ [Pimelobacter simplex]|uniref:gas vesicle protein GvpJ n=1 Tax=Nocardioides simplex TaxID=2045 RepID=UPI001933C1A9|nr:gas vesicle protein [Pimelobacter simplex]